MKPNNQRIQLSLLMTGVFTLISYTLMLVPLALYGVAQVYALHGKKPAVILSVLVVVLLAVCALFTGSSAFVIGTVLALISSPVFLVASYLRSKKTKIYITAALIFAPAVIFISALFSAPVLDEAAFSRELDRVEQQFLQKKQEKLQELKTQVTDVSRFETQRDGLEALSTGFTEQLAAVRNNESVRSFVALSPVQKIGFFVYGAGAGFLLMLLVSCLACLVFLDSAFEQVEKLQAVLSYVSNTHFDRDFVSILKSILGRSFSGTRLNSDLRVLKHGTLNEVASESKGTLFGLIKPVRPQNALVIRNYIFNFGGSPSGWNLWKFRMPLGVVITALVFCASIVYLFGDVSAILESFGKHSTFALILALFSLISIFILSVLVLQGLFTMLKRSSLFLLMILGLGLSLLSGSVVGGFGPYVLLALFGVIGLLDYAYDFRGLKSKS